MTTNRSDDANQLSKSAANGVEQTLLDMEGGLESPAKGPPTVQHASPVQPPPKLRARIDASPDPSHLRPRKSAVGMLQKPSTGNMSHKASTGGMSHKASTASVMRSRAMTRMQSKAFSEAFSDALDGFQNHHNPEGIHMKEKENMRAVMKVFRHSAVHNLYNDRRGVQLPSPPTTPAVKAASHEEIGSPMHSPRDGNFMSSPQDKSPAGGVRRLGGDFFDDGWDAQSVAEKTLAEDVEAEDLSMEDYKHLGELVDLDWYLEKWRFLRFLSLALVLYVPGTVVALFKPCVVMKGLCVQWWALTAAVMVASYPAMTLAVKLLSIVLKHSRSIHSNHVYFFVRLHSSIASLAWATTAYIFWVSYIGQYLTGTHLIGKRLLACHLAYRLVWLLKNLLVLEIANRHMWRPYLERVQQNIFAQYLVLILTDFALGYDRNWDDQFFALQFAENQGHSNQMSLFAISKAIGFVPGNKLKHPLFAVNGTSSIDNKKSARIFGGMLFDRLVETATPPATPRESPFGSPSHQRMPNGAKNGAPSSPPSATPAMPEPVHRVSSLTSGEDIDRIDEGDEEAFMLSEGQPSSRNIGGDALGGRKQSQMSTLRGVRQITEEDLSMPEPELTLDMLRPAMHKRLAIKLFEMLDTDKSASISRQEFTSGMVNIYLQRKSLALTLKDYEAILQKLGYLISALCCFLLLFIFLYLFGQNPMVVGMSWLSLVFSFSFLMNTSCQNFLESCIFIFVTRAYDVGDRVVFIDQHNDEMTYVVEKINMLSTVFRRTDEQYTVWPNQQLAKREVRNLRRSGPGVHLLSMSVAIDTPSSKLDAIAENVRHLVAEEQPGLGVVPKSVGYSFGNITKGNELTTTFFFQQKINWQDAGARFKCHHVIVERLAQQLVEHGVTYRLVEQPVTMQGKLI